jgi:hypothetical protein
MGFHRSYSIRQRRAVLYKIAEIAFARVRFRFA